MEVYGIQDSQGRTIEVFSDIEKAKHEMVEHAYSIIDKPVLQDVRCFTDMIMYAVYEDGKRVFGEDSGGFTIELFIIT